MKARSVMECGSPLPLSHRRPQSARGLAQSKTWRTALLPVFCFILLHSSFILQAQSYSIDWFTIDGGGPSTNGQYTVAGTIGQPDASQQPITGGHYSLVGGFWALYAVQTPGAPLLTIWRTTTNTAAVYWPSPSTGYVLQQNTNSVSSVNWSNIASGIQDNGTTKTLIFNTPSGNRFYRLFKP